MLCRGGMDPSEPGAAGMRARVTWSSQHGAGADRGRRGVEFWGGKGGLGTGFTLCLV